MIEYLKKRELIMNYKKYFKSLILIAISTVLLTTSSYVNANTQQTVQKAQSQTTVKQQQGISVKPLSVVNSPSTYLNKSIIMNARFDKFSTLGLDYKPAFKSSEEYISFLIKRDDTSFNIPLSEMKLFLKRSTAEKFIDLKTNDEIEITGTVFSDALGDAWVDVNELKITKKAPEEVKNK